MALYKLACVLVMAMVVTAPLAEALTCGQVVSRVSPCLGYLQSKGTGPVPGPCCAGARTLNNEAKSTPDRQAACNCLKSVAKNVRGINLPLAAALPGKCGFKAPYKISPSTDCSKVR